MASVLDDLIGEAFELDESLRIRVIRMAHSALDEAEFMLKHGDPMMKGRVINQFLKTFSKYMEHKGSNDEIEQLRTMLEQLRVLVMNREPGELGKGEMVVDVDEVEVDGPKR